MTRAPIATADYRLTTTTTTHARCLYSPNIHNTGRVHCACTHLVPRSNHTLYHDTPPPSHPCAERLFSRILHLLPRTATHTTGRTEPKQAHWTDAMSVHARALSHTGTYARIPHHNFFLQRRFYLLTYTLLPVSPFCCRCLFLCFFFSCLLIFVSGYFIWRERWGC